MTPNDIYNRKFDKAAVGGYKAEDVNRFLIEMGDYAQSLLNEQAELEEKLEILAEKLEEYRSDEESLRAAIVGAQKLGDSVIKDSKHKAEIAISEAKAKAGKIIAEAEAQAATMLDDTRNNIASEQYALDRIKASVVKFRRQILSMYEQQVVLVKDLPFNENEITEPQRPAFLKKAEEQSQPAAARDSIGNLPGPAIDYDEDVPELTLKEEETRPKQSHFGPLLFGEDFSLTRKE